MSVADAWEQKRIRYLFRERSEKGFPDEEPLAATQHAGVIPKSQLAFKTMEAVTSDLGLFKLVRQGDFVISLRSFEGGLEYSGYQGILSPAYTVLAPCGDVHAGFFKYLLKSEEFVQSLGRHKKGIRDGQAVPFSTLQDDYLRVPAPSVQERIANFLDDKTARIDALIAEKERLIERLSELRESFISNSVTLPGTAGWVPTRLKYLVQEIVDTEHKTVPFCEGGDYLVARTTNIKKGKLVLDGAKYTDAAGFEEWTRRALPTPGDILFTREAPAGEACLVPEGIPLCLGQRTVLIRLRKDLAHPPFVLWSLYGGLAARFISDLSQGSTVAHFNMPDIGNIPLFVGPIDEQRSRTTELELRVADMDALTMHADEHITRLREYRSSLISAAVTGQISIN